MSVIFDQLDNIQLLRFRFTQVIKLGVSIYYIENCNLKRLVVTDNQIALYNESETINVLQNVSQICSDGKTLFCLQTNGDLYQIDQQPKLLISSKNYMSITPTTAIDHSGRGFFWKDNKPIYSHCKHISTYQDKMTLITIGGKIFNIENNTQIPIQQLNGLEINGYFKKSLLFQFGGIAITENGDAYCYNTKMIKLKTSNLEDIQASNRFIFGIQGKYILQWNLDDFQNHQFFVHQTIFKKMNYGHEIQINCKKKEFQEVKFIFSNQYSQYCCASIQQISNKNQNDQSISVLERTFCRSTFQNLKQQLFDQWDPPSKRKAQEVRQSKFLRGERTDRSDASNRQTDRIDRKDDISQQVQKHQQQNNNILIEKQNKQDKQINQQEQKCLQIDSNFNFKNSLKQSSDILAPLEISKFNLNDKIQKQETQQLNNSNKSDKLVDQIQQKQYNLKEQKQEEQLVEQGLNNQNNEQQQKLQKIEQQQQLLQQQQTNPSEQQLLQQQQTNPSEQQLLNSINMPKQCFQEIKQPSKLLEQYKKQFDQILISCNQQNIQQQTDNFEDFQQIKEIHQENIYSQQNIIRQKLQSIKEIYDQTRFKTQNNSLYTLDEESSVEQSICQQEQEKGRFFQRQTLQINDLFDNDFKQVSNNQENQKLQFSSKDIHSPTQSLENKIKFPQLNLSELQLPPIQSSLNNFLSKLQLKPEKTIDQILKSQTQKEEENENIPQSNPSELISHHQITQTKKIRSFLKPEQMQNQQQKNAVEIMDQQSIIDYQNNSDFIDQQHDSFMQILQTDKKQSENSKIQNIMSIFDQIHIQPIKRSPSKMNMFKKQDQENKMISDSNGQLDYNLLEIKNILIENHPKILDKKLSPPKTNSKLHKNLVTFSQDISQEDIEDRVMQVVNIDQNLQSASHKHSPIKSKSPIKDNNISSSKKYSLQLSEQKVLTKINQNADVRQPSFDVKIIPNISEQKQSLSRLRIQPLNCNAVRPEKIYTPLKSRRNSTARGSSIETNRFKQLQIDSQVVVPEIQQNQTPLINKFEPLDLSNAMYHIDQTLFENTTKRTPVAQVLDMINVNQKSNQKILKEPQLIKVSSSSQIPPSLRTNSVGPISKKTEVSPLKVQRQIKNQPHSKSVNDDTIRLKRRQQDIILRKLFFKLDIHLKLNKLEFMFNLKQKNGK